MNFERENLLISTDPGLLDIDFVCRSLNSTYWAGNRPRPVIEESIRNSVCFGVYEKERQEADRVCPGRDRQGDILLDLRRFHCGGSPREGFGKMAHGLRDRASLREAVAQHARNARCAWSLRKVWVCPDKGDAAAITGIGAGTDVAADDNGRRAALRPGWGASRKPGRTRTVRCSTMNIEIHPFMRDANVRPRIGPMAAVRGRRFERGGFPGEHPNT